MSNLYGLTFQLEEPTPNKPTKVINIMVDEGGEKYINYLHQKLQQKENIRKEVREYITGYDSISILQGLDNIEENKDLDDKTIREMIRRYMIVHDKVLEILDKDNK